MTKPPGDGGSSDPEPGGTERNPEADNLDGRRRKLEAELALRRKPDGKDDGTEKTSSYAKAFQLSTEFVAAIFVGAFLGYWFDRFAGTSPWGLIVLLMLGFVAGVLNVMRSAGLVAENSPDRSKDGDT